MVNEDLIKRLTEVIPKDSIGRYDLLPVFKDKRLFAEIVEHLSAPYIGKVDCVVAPEAIGWIVGSAIARELNVGFMPLRKKGKLPYPKAALLSRNYVDYSGQAKTLEIKTGSIAAGDRILIVDEWTETGRTLRCSMDLLKELGCTVVGLATIGINDGEGTREWIDTGFIQYIGKDI